MVHDVEALRRLVIVHDDRHDNRPQADCRDIVKVRDAKVLLCGWIRRSLGLECGATYLISALTDRIEHEPKGTADEIQCLLQQTLRRTYCMLMIAGLFGKSSKPRMSISYSTWELTCLTSLMAERGPCQSSEDTDAKEAAHQALR